MVKYFIVDPYSIFCLSQAGPFSSLLRFRRKWLAYLYIPKDLTHEIDTLSTRQESLPLGSLVSGFVDAYEIPRFFGPRLQTGGLLYPIYHNLV